MKKKNGFIHKIRPRILRSNMKKFYNTKNIKIDILSVISPSPPPNDFSSLIYTSYGRSTLQLNSVYIQSAPWRLLPHPAVWYTVSELLGDPEVSANLYCNLRTSVLWRLRDYLWLLMGHLVCINLYNLQRIETTLYIYITLFGLLSRDFSTWNLIYI